MFSSSSAPVQQVWRRRGILKRVRKKSGAKYHAIVCSALLYSATNALAYSTLPDLSSTHHRTSSRHTTTQMMSTTSTSVNGAASHIKPRTNSLFNVDYDAQSIINFYDQRPWEVGIRLNMLGLPLLGWYFGLLSDKLLKIDDKDSVKRKRGAELRMHFVRSKSVALIKSGQALSLRPDLLKSKIWAEELGKLVDEVGSFSDLEAMKIMQEELSDLLPRIRNAQRLETQKRLKPKKKATKSSRLLRLVENDPLLSLFEFYNDCRPIASASIGKITSCSDQDPVNTVS